MTVNEAVREGGMEVKATVENERCERRALTTKTDCRRGPSSHPPPTLEGSQGCYWVDR